MPAQEMGSLEEFLNHSGTDKSGGMLGNWKAKDTHKVQTVMHTKCLPYALWRHGGIPRIVVLEDEETGDPKPVLWAGNWNCHEDEKKVLKKQFFRDKVTGKREAPPQVCGICKTIEAIRQLVNDEKISWTDAVFRFKAGDDVQVLHAGGMFNAFGARDLSAQEKAEMKKAAISSDESWKENCNAKLNYALSVLDIANPDNGIQTAIEPGYLGDQVKDVIADSIADAKEGGDASKGNPLEHPFVIEWSYDKTIPFGKGYKARPRKSIALTETMLGLVRGPKPDISKIVAPFKQSVVRKLLEEAALPNIKGLLDWDALFGKLEEEEPEPDGEEGDTDFPPKDEAPAKGAVDKAIEKQETKKTAAAAAKPGKKLVPSTTHPPGIDEDDENCVGCEGCDKPMDIRDPKCPHCGKEYEVEQEAKPEPEPEPAKTPRKRSDVAKEKAAAAGAKKPSF